jgi:hypothetical protein
MRAFLNTYPCSSEPCRGEDTNSNVTADDEKWGVNEWYHSHLLPLCKATLGCYTAVGWGRRLEPIISMTYTTTIFWPWRAIESRAHAKHCSLLVVSSSAAARQRVRHSRHSSPYLISLIRYTLAPAPDPRDRMTHDRTGDRDAPPLPLRSFRFLLPCMWRRGMLAHACSWMTHGGSHAISHASLAVCSPFFLMLI